MYQLQSVCSHQTWLQLEAIEIMINRIDPYNFWYP